MKVTQQHIDALIEQSTITTMTTHDKVTVASLKLPCGFAITKTSACVDPEDYDPVLGKGLCLRKITQKLWELEGYLASQPQPNMKAVGRGGEVYMKPFKGTGNAVIFTGDHSLNDIIRYVIEESGGDTTEIDALLERLKPSINNLIRKWGEDVGLTGEDGKATISAQFKQMFDEVLELRDELGDLEGLESSKKFRDGSQHVTYKADEIRDRAKMELGDVYVTTVLMAQLLGSSIEECGAMAYEKIQKRVGKGKIVGNRFVKDSDLKAEDKTGPACNDECSASEANAKGPYRMGIAEALKLAELGAKMRREGWTNRGYISFSPAASRLLRFVKIGSFDYSPSLEDAKAKDWIIQE